MWEGQQVVIFFFGLFYGGGIFCDIDTGNLLSGAARRVFELLTVLSFLPESTERIKIKWPLLVFFSGEKIFRRR